MAGFMMEVAPTSRDAFSDEDWKALEALNGRSDAEAVTQARSILKRYPDALAKVGDLAQQLERNAIRDIAGHDDNLTGDALAARCAELRRSFGYDDASPIERLLIDRIVASWLHLQRAEMARRLAWVDGTMLGKRAFLDGAVSRGQSDHHQAIIALAKVRRLGLPALQVNIAGPGAQQLNVVSEASGESPSGRG